MARWLIPSLGYVLALGVLGVTSKLALRSIPWQGLLALTTMTYAVTAIALLALGQIELSRDINLFWGVVSTVVTVGALVLLYVALGYGDAGKVISVTAAYPAVTLILAAIFLSEPFTLGRVAGVLLVIAGVVILSVVE